MQRENTSDVLSVLSFDPLIVYLRSIPALAFMSTHTTSRYVVTVTWLWPSLTHFGDGCVLYIVYDGAWGGTSVTSLLSALANVFFIFICVHEVPAYKAF